MGFFKAVRERVSLKRNNSTNNSFASLDTNHCMSNNNRPNKNENSSPTRTTNASNSNLSTTSTLYEQPPRPSVASLQVPEPQRDANSFEAFFANTQDDPERRKKRRSVSGVWGGGLLGITSPTSPVDKMQRWSGGLGFDRNYPRRTDKWGKLV